MNRLIILCTIAVLCLATGGLALAQSDTAEAPPTWTPRTDGFGAAVMINYPHDDFGKRTDTGYGLHGMFVKPLIPLLSFTGDIGFNHFPADEKGLPEVNVWEFTGGLRFEFGAFYMGGEAGYFTKIDEGSFIPSAGFLIRKFEIAVRWKAVGGSSWTGLRLGYFF